MNQQLLPPAAAADTDTTEEEEKVEEVKKLAKDRRAAVPGEPTCAVCGRYGEYICDQTDDDVCSLECKAALLPSPRLPRLPATDECFYVRDVPGQPTCNQTELLRNRLDINVRGDGVPPPVLSFSSIDLPHKLLRNIELASYDMPTPVQMQAIPAALTGKSLLVSADTGSGKTASFLVPIVSLCVSIRGRCTGGDLDCKAPLAMVLSPTRELCVQVENHAKLLAKGLPFKTALVVGGDAMAGQIYRIRQGVELIVGTPGRLIDLLTKHDRDIRLDDVRVLVLDEVDCMLQRGFVEQVLQLFRALSRPQVLMYSATISPELERVARSMAKEIISISVGQPNKPSKAVRQLAIWVDSKHKKQKLFDILTSKQHFTPPAVVYVGSRLGADLLCNAIVVTTGLKALSIHGEKPMKDRRETMRSFLVGEVPVIVSTGVLGRGIDLLGVRQVIVFDLPNSIKEYIHQVGRASRMGEEGTALVFVNEENRSLFPEFIEVLKSAGAAIPRELVNSRYSVPTVPVGKSNRKRKYGT